MALTLSFSYSSRGPAILVGSSCPVAQRQPVCTQLFLFEGAQHLFTSSADIWVGASDAQSPEEAGNYMSWNSTKIK